MIRELLNTLRKFSEVKRYSKFFHPTQGLPEKLSTGLYSWNAMDTPYIGA